MVDTRSGVAGACVASHVMEELSNDLVRVPDPRPQTVAKAVADWDELKYHEYVTHSAAQVF